MKNSINSILKPKKQKWEYFYNSILNTENYELGNEINPQWSHIYYKAYARMPKVLLPKPKDTIKKPFIQILLERKSNQNFSKKTPLSLEKISSLLYYALGINPSYTTDLPHRFYPSGGARYPIEAYILPSNVLELQKYIHHYYVRDHILEKLFEYTKKDLEDVFLYNFPTDASCIIILTGILQRTTIKYGDRGYNYTLIETGHIAQNIYLLASALDIDCCAIGGYKENTLSKLLDLNMNEEIPLYSIVLR
ncbi:MAG TPA: SagB/ThcOx family dehydrogenase [Candidatus Woesebacteria bacterium]|nr:SagB/ThcOx family dehydrogenase [Candidatus Woesebacteria bacterium]